MAGLAVLILGAAPFFVATTFVGDDHLFLAFARYEDHPLRAFVTDEHGGEFYRPIPMLLWWLIARIRGPSHPWPFALLAAALHGAVATLTGVLLGTMRSPVESGLRWRTPRTSFLAGACFLLAPLPREAAYWYAASTDLLAAGLGLATVLLLLRDARIPAMATFALACGSKETALVFPVLAAIALRVRGGLSGQTILRRTATLIPIAASYLAARALVLGGLGGSGDPPASMARRCAQIIVGLIHLFPGDDVLPEPLSSIAGLAACVAVVVLVVRPRGQTGATAISSASKPGSPSESPLPSPLPSPGLLPGMLLWIFASVLPLLAAPSVEGARYFYVAAIGACSLLAEGLSRLSAQASITAVVALAGLSAAQAAQRSKAVQSYEERVSVVRRAVSTGAAQGAQVFHVAAGIKDLDLVVKEDETSRAHGSSLLVLGDVPASFVVAPDVDRASIDFLLAKPALPPSGAYHFGDRRIVGLARRGDDPTLDEVLTHFPDLRRIRLSLVNGRVISRDITNER